MLKMGPQLIYRKWKASRVTTIVPSILLVSFLIIFPKGGIKVGDIPVTFGYILLGIFAIFAMAANLLSGRLMRLTKPRWMTLIALLPFQFLAIVIIYFNGNESMGYTLSFLVSLVFIPLTFVIVFGPQIDRMDLSPLMQLIRFAVFVVAVYGIFIFIYKLMTGKFIEIPLLTVNLGDVGALEEKHIQRGWAFKLISTYNNGNIYGVSLLMLLPLYALLERRIVRLAIVKLSLILTLSRTVYIGLLLYEVLYTLYIKRISMKAILGVTGMIVFLIGLIYVTVRFFGMNIDFLFDSSLGGRREAFSYLHLTLLPYEPFTFISEITYLSVLYAFGVIGLAFFIIAMTMPLLLHTLRRIRFSQTKYKKSIALGLMLYLILAGSDGATLYIPIMAFYWFLVTLLLSPSVPGILPGVLNAFRQR